MQKSFIVLCALLFTAAPLWAEVVKMDPVVVTATRTSTPLSQVASSVTVITAEEIEAKQQPLVVDVLRSVPGVYVARNGGPGGTTSIYLRGTDNKHTLVMIDGVELGDPSSPGATVNLTNLAAINIERIEVVRGAQSVLYGSDAIGGVINIITKKGNKKPTGFASIEGGSFNTWIGKGGFSVASEAGHLSFAVANSHSDGFSAANENNGNTEDDGYKNTSFSLNGGARPSDILEINLSANYSDAEYDMDGFAWGIGPVDADETAFTNTLTGHIEGVFHLLQDRWQLQLGSSLTKIDRDYPDSSWAKAYDGKKTKFELGNSFTVNEQHTLVFGTETETETAETDTGIDEDATTNAFYLQDEFIAGSFNATVGIRHDRHDDFGSKTTWRISSGYSMATTGTRLKGSVGTGFKAPSLYQLFDSYYGNQNLKAETSLGYDFGIEQGFFDHSLILQVTWFHNDIDDYIQWDPTGYQNTGSITTQGIETSLELYPAEFIDLRLNYTYTDSEDKDGNRLLRRPLHTGNFDLNFHFLEDKMVNFNILYIGERDDSNETLDDYILVNLSASHQITDNCKIFGRVDNLFDEDYEEVAGYGTAGLSGYAGIQLSF